MHSQGTPSATGPVRFDYVRDDAARRIHVTAHAALDASDLVDILDRQIAEGTWAFDILYDLRRVEGATAQADALIIADLVQGYVRTHGQRGRVALITRDDRMRGIGQTYANDIGKSGIAIQLFRDPVNADDWLDKPR
jgi:hypothetical protein